MSDASGDHMVHHTDNADGGSSVDDVEDAICEECDDQGENNDVPSDVGGDEDEPSLAVNDDDNENLLDPDSDDNALLDMSLPGTPLASEGCVDAHHRGLRRREQQCRGGARQFFQRHRL